MGNLTSRETKQVLENDSLKHLATHLGDFFRYHGEYQNHRKNRSDERHQRRNAAVAAQHHHVHYHYPREAPHEPRNQRKGETRPDPGYGDPLQNREANQRGRGRMMNPPEFHHHRHTSKHFSGSRPPQPRHPRQATRSGSRRPPDPGMMPYPPTPRAPHYAATQSSASRSASHASSQRHRHAGRAGSDIDSVRAGGRRPAGLHNPRHHHPHSRGPPALPEHHMQPGPEYFVPEGPLGDERGVDDGGFGDGEGGEGLGGGMQGGGMHGRGEGRRVRIGRGRGEEGRGDGGGEVGME